MTLVLELPEPVAEKLRADAKLRGVELETLAFERLTNGESKAVFDQSHFDELAKTDPAAAFSYLADHTPQNRARLGLEPLPDDAVKLSYEERESHLENTF